MLSSDMQGGNPAFPSPDWVRQRGGADSKTEAERKGGTEKGGEEEKGEEEEEDGGCALAVESPVADRLMESLSLFASHPC